MSYNPTIHHRRSIRLIGYDYSQSGLYFVTICCRDRECLFGEIVDGEMVLSYFGKIAYNEWVRSAEIRKEIEIHEYIVMPNHFHAIVEIVGTYGIRPKNDADNKGVCHTPLRSPSKTVGALVRGFKSSVTKQLGFPVWQRNYHEHIIRNEKSYQYIANYIINNPAKWENDRFYSES